MTLNRAWGPSTSRSHDSVTGPWPSTRATRSNGCNGSAVLIDLALGAAVEMHEQRHPGQQVTQVDARAERRARSQGW